MVRDIASSAISGQASPAAYLPAARKPVLAPSPARCADAARTRGEPIAASAAPYGRYLLLEVPGSWGRSSLDERHLGADAAQGLADAAADANANVLLIRRPGRHSAADAGNRPRAWALADTAPDAERILWGSWARADDLPKAEARYTAISFPGSSRNVATVT